MGNKYNYNRKLKDSRWNTIRKEVLLRDKYTCVNCSQDAIPMHVHHTYYDFDLDPWEYNIDSLITLCENCHEEHHKSDKILNKDLLDSINKCGFDKYGKIMLISAFEVKASELREERRTMDRFLIQQLCYAMFEPGATTIAERFSDLLLKRANPSIDEKSYDLKYLEMLEKYKEVINGI